MMKATWLCILLALLCASASAQQDRVTVGIASYYHHKFEGRKTSSGQVFRQDSLTAAHKSLAFGTRVAVKNLDNDSTVVVVVNDRLPQSSKRSIDLSYRAASQLNFIRKGLTKVEIRVLPEVKKEESTAGEASE
jgi:rare lipoprotein A